MNSAFKVGPYRQVQQEKADPALTWVPIYVLSSTAYFIDLSQVHPDNMVSVQVSSSFFFGLVKIYILIFLQLGFYFHLLLVTSIDLLHQGCKNSRMR